MRFRGRLSFTAGALRLRPAAKSFVDDAESIRQVLLTLKGLTRRRDTVVVTT